jgi:hypothetical protein
LKVRQYQAFKDLIWIVPKRFLIRPDLLHPRQTLERCNDRLCYIDIWINQYPYQLGAQEDHPIYKPKFCTYLSKLKPRATPFSFLSFSIIPRIIIPAGRVPILPLGLLHQQD